ncbi:mandelate racemase/muconate lactonizing enzyme family protein [Pedobacter puniceum]|jgi:L-alanine-DL-glutamate epimerase-like enolase superfamily enzyme|uniref:Mandelate racemase/muconate lactonizing enzyme family protein n=1 Tax=Pedobacter puniceum TaxID=2666136 RepID=A0A7K0FMK6_9SPHI|nr:mandelate racemase/muconate lactonizing enzyme family protein [Pedobacter puniceum]MRX46665.1 mandelate racemase/muconate lactonizing enzyme family protein [Pedobacter puniceum]
MHSIKSYAVFTAKAKLEKPIADATHTLTEISFIVLRIRLKDGTIGESYLLSFQYNPQAIIGALKDAGELLLGEKVFDTVKVFDKLNHANEYFGMEGLNRWAQGAFNIAMWDAWAKILGQPVWKVLGASKRQIPIYGSGGWISYSPDELIDEVTQYKNRGFKAVKIKVGKPDWKEDLERLRLVREAVGNEINIMMDANQGMNVANALQLAQAAKNLHINWFEEPILHDDYQGFELLRNQAGISIAMGEREYSLTPLRELLQRNAIDIWQPDILRLGGVEAWRNSAALAASFNVSVLPHYYKDYDIPLLCTISNGAGAESFDWIDTLIDHPLEIKDGMATPHNTPGWGFKFKDEYLRQV